MSSPLPRTGVEIFRIVQALVAFVAVIFPVYADAQDEAQAVVGGIGLLVLAVLEAKKRASVTPVLDPVGESGKPLVPIV